MDNLTWRGSTSFRPWSIATGRRQDIYRDAKPTNTLSKLDSAKMKLSKFKLKYGKQETQEDSDSSLSLSLSEPLTRTPPHGAELEVKEGPDEGETSSAKSNNSSEKITDDSLMDRNQDKNSETDLTAVPVRLSPIEIPPKSFISDQQQYVNNSPSDLSLSEISENVHSFSSLLKSEVHDDFLHATEEGRAIVPVPRVEMFSALERVETQASESSVASISSELPSSGQEIVQMASELASSRVPVVSEIPKLQPTQRSESSLHSNPEVPVTSTSVDSVSSKLESRKEKRSISSFAKHSPSKSSDQVSSPTLVPVKKERRNVKVQTYTKRSRQVQVDLSWTESEYERRSCPILRASSLPHGLRLIDQDPLDECLGSIGVGDAVQVLLKSQLRLTLGLLQREQALYINSCSAAARLERGYRQHTLSDTRKFIRREKKVRGKLRRDAKLEKEGTALIRKQ